MPTHREPGKPPWSDPNEWICYQCNKRPDTRVVEIADSFYCSECLMSAVTDGRLRLFVTPDTVCGNCGDDLGRYPYCNSCGNHDDCVSADEAGSECVECSDQASYCYSCAPIRCGECGDDAATWCESCISNGYGPTGSSECDECPATAIYHQCDTHAQPECEHSRCYKRVEPHYCKDHLSEHLTEVLGSAPSAQTSTVSDDGKVVTLDGVTVQWEI